MPRSEGLFRLEELARIDGIEAAFFYGSIAARLLGDAGPAPHDIELMVLGEPDVDAVYEACTRIEAAVAVIGELSWR